MLLDAILLIAGLTVLYFGAEAMVKGASQLALSFGISPLVVGLTVVAFGTSAPEFLVSFLAVVGGSEGISVGNVIGSNICNIALILGIAAVISPLPIAPSSLRFEYPFMFLATLALAAVAFDGRIGHIDGGILTVGIVVFIAWQLRGALRHHHAHRDSGNARPRGAAVGKNMYRFSNCDQNTNATTTRPRIKPAARVTLVFIIGAPGVQPTTRRPLRPSAGRRTLGS
jgi:cation:H+ antiporter